MSRSSLSRRSLRRSTPSRSLLISSRQSARASLPMFADSGSRENLPICSAMFLPICLMPCPMSAARLPMSACVPKIRANSSDARERRLPSRDSTAMPRMRSPSSPMSPAPGSPPWRIFCTALLRKVISVSAKPFPAESKPSSVMRPASFSPAMFRVSVLPAKAASSERLSGLCRIRRLMMGRKADIFSDWGGECLFVAVAAYFTGLSRYRKRYG